MRNLRALIVVACCLSMVATSVGPTTTWAGQPSPITRPRHANFVSYDVQLDATGKLGGKLTDRGGAALTRAPVVLYQGRNQVAQTRTDQHGRFKFEKLRGGAYQLYTVGRQAMVRTWTPGTAPPGAGKSLLIVADYGAVRGQYDMGDVLSSGVIPIIVVTSAAIAIPIIVNSNRNKAGSS